MIWYNIILVSGDHVVVELWVLLSHAAVNLTFALLPWSSCWRQEGGLTHSWMQNKSFCLCSVRGINTLRRAAMANEVVCAGLARLWALYGFKCDIIFCNAIYSWFFSLFFTLIVIRILCVAIYEGGGDFKDYVTSWANNQIRDYADER